MRRPKMTPARVQVKNKAQADRLQRNLEGQGSRAPATDNKRETDFLMRILWEGWRIGTGRNPTTEDVRKLSRALLNKAKGYLPEMKRMRR